MIHSMTGFGTARAEAGGQAYELELRTLNNRYLKVVVKLPDPLQFADSAVEKVIRGRIHRGTVTCTVRTRSTDTSGAPPLNTAALQGYVDQIGRVKVPAGMSGTVDLGALAALPGVCDAVETDEEERQAQTALLERLTGAALDHVIEMRRGEGDALRTDILSSCDRIEAELGQIAERAPVVVNEYHDRLSDRVATLLEKSALELERESLMREVAIYAERCDISEEVIRLRSHLQQYRALCGTREEVGRKLEFLAQELLREANTIGSKTSDVRIARSVVEVKCLVDRLKEQSQNVE
jgi:uncharacterized protein (TIGR00255 family)